jgi:hypothetical protein
MSHKFPLELHTCSQFMLLPLSIYADTNVFNMIFCFLLMKDFIYKISYLIAAHHLLGILGCLYYSSTIEDTYTLGVAEFGSGMYNTYILAKQYNTNIEIAYALYAITMTLSNLQLLLYLNSHREKRMYIKAPFYILVITRQYYVFIE